MGTVIEESMEEKENSLLRPEGPQRVKDFSEEGEGVGGKGIKPDGPVVSRARGQRSMLVGGNPQDF